MKPRHKLPPWLRPKSPPVKPVVGVVWYTQEEWARVKAAAVDPERFEDSFQEWTQVANAALKNLLAVGIVGTPFMVQADELLAWCLARGKPNNAAARAEFVTASLHGRGGADGA